MVESERRGLHELPEISGPKSKNKDVHGKTKKKNISDKGNSMRKC
jgi:hypothetical protein